MRLLDGEQERDVLELGLLLVEHLREGIIGNGDSRQLTQLVIQLPKALATDTTCDTAARCATRLQVSSPELPAEPWLVQHASVLLAGRPRDSRSALPNCLQSPG